MCVLTRTGVPDGTRPSEETGQLRTIEGMFARGVAFLCGLALLLAAVTLHQDSTPKVLFLHKFLIMR